MLERLIEKILFSSRWILAPVYVGMSLALIALGVKFFQELFHVLTHTLSMPESEIVLTILTLIDMVLVASLVVMVMFSGYENFVSRIEIENNTEELGWLGKLDANTLKLKVAASIVAISSIQLLRAYMDALDTPNDKLLWYVIVHLTFVVSAVLMGVLDKISFTGHREK